MVIMALKKTQNQLKREFKEELKKLKWAIYGKCYDCYGFQADRYEDCGVKDCPLYPYRLKQSKGSTSAGLASYLMRIKTQIQRLGKV